MKFQITFKDPDGTHDAIREIINDALVALRQKAPDEPALETADFEEVFQESKKEELQPILKKWIRYEEYITIEFDTETGTATVIPAK